MRAQAGDTVGRAARAGKCALSQMSVFILFRFQYGSQSLSCLNVEIIEGGGKWHFKAVFPQLF